MRSETRSVEGADGVHLHVVRSIPDEATACARLLVVHGLGEHGGRYEHVAGALAKRGFEVWRYDQRGNGRSSGRQGDTSHYAHWVDDLDRVVAHAGGARGLFLYAHSFGGQVALKWVLEIRPALAGLILSAPWLRLALEPPRWKLIVAAWAATLCPQMRLSSGVGANLLSRDEVFLRGLDPENLVHRKVSVRSFHSAMRAGAEVLSRAGELTTPLLLLHGACDQLMAPTGSAEFFERCGSADKRFWLIEHALHEPHNDVCRDEVIGEIGNWVVERAGFRGGATSGSRQPP